jgi:hypothetical protein
MKIAALLFILTMSCNVLAASEFGGITFDKSVPEEQVRILQDDMRYLYALPVQKGSPDFKIMAGFSGFSGPVYHNWIINRIRYVIGQEMNPYREFSIVAENYQHENPDEFPNVGFAAGAAATQKQGRKAVLSASNMGVIFYSLGKEGKMLLGVQIGDNMISISSPRIGILQIGEGLFQLTSKANSELAAPVNRLIRMATFFHEARHSDGRKKEAGMLHVACPEGHAYAGLAACDQMSNGPYAIDGNMLKIFSENCRECSTPEKEALRLSALDRFSRILGKNPIDASPEGKFKEISLKESKAMMNGERGID